MAVYAFCYDDLETVNHVKMSLSIFSLSGMVTTCLANATEAISLQGPFSKPMQTQPADKLQWNNLLCLKKGNHKPRIIESPATVLFGKST